MNDADLSNDRRQAMAISVFGVRELAPAFVKWRLAATLPKLPSDYGETTHLYEATSGLAYFLFRFGWNAGFDVTAA
jgi:hypothetical protein